MLIEETSLKILQGHEEGVLETVFLPDGNLASCSSDKKIKIWNLDDNEEICELSGHSDCILSLCLLFNDLLGLKTLQSKSGTAKKGV